MPARYETIAGWINEFGWTRGAELGLFDGRTFIYLLEHCPKLHLTGVDVWDLPGFSEGPTKSGEKCRCQYCNETREARKAWSVQDMEVIVRHAAAKHSDRAVVHKMPTVQAADLVKYWELDFVFIDGDHSTEGVKTDIAHWRNKVKPGGRLIGHDWNMASVQDAVRSHYTYKAIHETDDHLWWVAC